MSEPRDNGTDDTRSYTPISKGTTVSHYSIIDKIGAGGMGEVYLAEDTELNRKVALKFLPLHLCQDEDCRKRFKREAQAAAVLEHQNIVTVHEVSEYQGRPYIVMQYIEGRSLRDILRDRELHIDEIVDLGIQICEGLGKAHQAGVIHRDIKPSNIVIGSDGRPRILDFGLAAIKGDTHITKTGSTLGTVGYMSPEQVEGKTVDERSDLFSVGIVLFEMITGRPPFKGETEAATMNSILNETPEPLARYKSDIPDELQRTVSKLLEKAPSLRYQSTMGLISDLKTLARDQLSDSRKEVSRPSIAVLPFTNLSADPEQEYFCDGMAEEIINALTHVEGLRVVARTSCFAFKGRHEDIREIGRKLNVDNVLEGSVRKAGNRIRITGQLIKISDGYHLWSDRYDRELSDIFEVQDEISMAIVDKLKVKLLGGEHEQIVKRPTDNLDAYNLYLKGRYHWNKRTKQGMRKGLEYFQQAVEEDPAYVLPYTGIADCYNLLGWYGYVAPKEAFPKAKVAAEKARDMDATLAEVHTSLATVKEFYDWDWSAAEKGYRRAIELNPSYLPAHHRYGEFLCYLGRHEEAFREIECNLNHDPLSLVYNTLLGEVHYFARQYDHAIEAGLRTIEMEQNFFPAHWLVAFAYAQKQMFKDAVTENQKAADLSGEANPLIITQRGILYSLSGKNDAAREVLDELSELSKRRFVSPFYTALIHLGLDEKNSALKWLEKAYDEHDHALETLKVEPMLDSLRSQPRFEALLKRMKL
jgi:serine/threonine-protein kinase